MYSLAEFGLLTQARDADISAPLTSSMLGLVTLLLLNRAMTVPLWRDNRNQ